MHNVTILGSTGTIGVNTLDVIARHPDRFRVTALTANKDAGRLIEQCLKFQPEFAVCVDPRAAEAVNERLREKKSETQVFCGASALTKAASLPQVDIVMAAIVGAAGLLPALAAAKSGKRLLLANKEALVMTGELFVSAVRENGGQLIPIDSEHNAIYQALPSGYDGDAKAAGVKRIWLTASGGPFRALPLDAFHAVTPEQACAHPKWAMGKKISVDSATMMNKGLELIEACFLFNLPPERVRVVVHPQSIVHSLVEYVDGSLIAQLSNPDMRTPIAYGLGFPERIESGAPELNLSEIENLAFDSPDNERFPCLRLAERALKLGGVAPAVLNAANEVAVNHFLMGNIAFTFIPEVIERVLEEVKMASAETLERVLAADAEARSLAEEWINKSGSRIEDSGPSPQSSVLIPH
ncbi:MAG: 1-deoxy-D-xylulose-5-phosphate reductoisomerase [Burkholderiales bacterium]